MSTLAEWVIQMSAAGQEATLAKMQEVQTALDSLDNTAKGVNATFDLASKAVGKYDSLKKSLDDVKKAFDGGKLSAEQAKEAMTQLEKAAIEKDAASELRKQREEKRQKDLLTAEQKRVAETLKGNAAIAGTYNMLAGTVLNLARGGLAGTSEGEVIGLRFQMISREVANLFVPAIHAGIDALDRIVNKFRSLDGRQQENIGKWLAMGTGALFVANQLPKVAAGFEMIGTAMKAALAGNPIGLLLVGAAAVVSLLANTEKGRASLEKLGRVATDVLGPVLEKLAESLSVIADELATAADRLGPVVDQIGSLTNQRGEGGRGGVLLDLLAPGLGAIGRGGPEREVVNILFPAAGLLGSSGGQGGGIGGFGSGFTGAPRNELTPRGGGFEAVTETFRRLQSAAAKTDVPERSLEQLTRIREGIDALLIRHNGLAAGLTQSRPAVGE